MARLARLVAPDLPHHVTARGNFREPIFFETGDQPIYLDILDDQMRKARVDLLLLAQFRIGQNILGQLTTD
jgi:putative transposase